MKDFIIREANKTDLELIKNFMLLALESDPLAFTVDKDEYIFCSTDWWEKYLDAYFWPYKGRMFLAFDEDRLVGMIGITFKWNTRSKHIANLYWFYVDNNYRKNGIGKTLMESVFNYIIECKKNIKKINLQVIEKQLAAIKMYEKYGFVQVGKLEKELNINGEYLSAIIMEKFLD